MATSALFDRSYFPWVFGGSVVLHVFGVRVLPVAKDAVPPSATTVVEWSEAPLPPPAPRAAEPEPAPPKDTPKVALRAAQRSANTDASPPARSHAPPAMATNDAPVDFTNTVLSNDGPGLAVGTPGGRGSGAGAKTANAPLAATPVAAKVGPTIVAVRDLSRIPRAPGLDDALEKNYPLEARRSGIAGAAVLRVQILPEGRVGRAIRVSETHPGFAEACEKTVRGVRWEAPQDREGRFVATEITYGCRFEVRN